MIFSLRHVFSACPCGAPERFLWVTSVLPDGAGMWCPRCKGTFRHAEAKPIPVTQSQAHDVMPDGVKTRMTYNGYLYPDGLVSWEADGKALTVEQMRKMQSSYACLMSGALDRQKHLRGADRMVFFREGDAYKLRFEDETVTLYDGTAGRRKTPSRHFTCERCRSPIETGTKVYRVLPDRRRWGGGWSEMRFCARCVESCESAVKSKGPLRVIDGGRG